LADPIHKIIITGTGRAGTTFLVQLLTELGLDTGYTRQTWSRDYYEHCEAGLEFDVFAKDAPYIVKNPDFCETLPALLATGKFKVDHVLVPVRELDAAAQSRIRVGGANGNVPGGLVGTAEPSAQKAVLAESFHRLIYTLTEHDIPHTLLHFPRIVRDPEYTRGKLLFLASAIDANAFNAAFQKVARPKLVHEFDGKPAETPGNAGSRFLRAEHRKRIRRRVKRVAAAIAILGAALLAARLLTVRSATRGPVSADVSATAAGARS
jgi:hypothetical protein